MQSNYLSIEEYSRLFEHMILAEYDNLFHNADLRNDLGLDAQQTGRFAVEYLCAALYLLEDITANSRLPEDIRSQLTGRVRSGVFLGILREKTPEGEAQYLLYALKRGMEFAQIYRRDDETMKLLIENCLDQAQLTDPIARIPQSLYLMQLLPGLLQLFCDLLCSAQAETGESIRIRLDTPDHASE